MKKLMTMAIAFMLHQASTAQITTADFEGFGLAPNSAYSSTNSLAFQTSNAVFTYDWLSSFGGYWIGGYAYTNKYDSSTAGFTNLYGVKSYKGHNNSATYVVAQDHGTIRLKTPQARVNGFYITNTTYAYTSMRKGDAFARKFGDTTGTGSGTTIAQGSYPDFFKVTFKGYSNGALKNDSAVFYLADYRFANNALDYIVNTWQYFDVSNLGLVDSIAFKLFSSDNSGGYMNTPGFFAMDDFSTSPANPVGLNNISPNNLPNIYPNPCENYIHVTANNNAEFRLYDGMGNVVLSGKINEGGHDINMETLAAGIYHLFVRDEDGYSQQQIIKSK